MIIGLTGPRCSGKTEVSKILSENGFIVLSFGDEVRLERDARGLPADCDLHEFAVDLRKEFGEKYWAERIIEKINLFSGKNYVVEGIRTFGDLELFKKINGFILIGVSASMEIRFRRSSENKRGRTDDTSDYMDFVRRCERDESSGFGGLQSAKTFQDVNYVIENNGSAEELKLKVLKLIEELRK